MPSPSTHHAPEPVVLTEVVFPERLNHHGTYFGGAALSLMSRAAFVAASRTARTDVVLASCERVDFRRPIELGDFVEARASVLDTDGRSITVGVDVTAETLRTGHRRQALNGVFRMVALAPRTAEEVAGAGAGTATDTKDMEDLREMVR